jgi:hypothetical protein
VLLIFLLRPPFVIRTFRAAPLDSIGHEPSTTGRGRFFFATDVTFTSQTEDTGNCPPCPSYVGPTQGLIEVDNPPSPCVEAQTMGDAATGDASRDGD